MLHRLFLFGVLLYSAFSSPTFARPDDSTGIGGLVQSMFGPSQPKIGLIGAFDAQAKNDGGVTQSTYNVHVLRFYLRGSAGNRFSYVYQADLNGTVQTLDLKFTCRITDWLKADGGQFKPAFGKEFLLNEANLPFVERSVAAQAASPGRQRGIQLTGSDAGGIVAASAGLFSGNGISSPSDPKISLLTGKLRLVPAGGSTSPLQTELSASIMYTRDNADLSAIQLIRNDRLVWNGQARIGYGDVWTEAEYANASSDNIRTANSVYCNAGWKFIPEAEVIGRFDWKMNYWMFDSTAGDFLRTPGGITRKVVLGMNWYPSTGIKLQADYERDQTEGINSAFLNVQYSINDQ